MNPNDAFGQRTARGEVTLIRVLPASVERVWAFLTESEKRGEWLASGPIEPRVGGKVDFRFFHGNLSAEKTTPAKYAEMSCGHPMSGLVTQYQPPHLLAYTWAGDKEPSEVIFKLTPEGEKTRLIITHKKLGSPGMESNVAAGWHTHLAVLIARLEGCEPPGFWSTHTRLEHEYQQRLA